MIDVIHRMRFSTLHNYRRLLLLCALFCALVGAQRLFSAQLLHIQTITNGPHGQQQSAIKIAANGNPVLAFPLNGNITVVRCGNSLCNTGNVTKTLTGTGGSIDLSLALDANDTPVISYYFANNQDLRVVRCGDPVCTTHVMNTLDSAGNVGKYSSLQLAANGNPIISYYDGTNRDLKLVHCGDLTCTPAGNTRRVVVGSDSDVGAFSSMVLDNSGNPIISYYQDGFTLENLSLVHCGDPTCAANNIGTDVDLFGNTGLYTSIARNSAGYPVISYQGDQGGITNTLKLAVCGDVNCTTKTLRTIDNSTSSIGLATSLALSPNDNPRIAYSDNVNNQIKVVLCSDPLCQSATFFTLDSFPSNISWAYTSVAVDAYGTTYVGYTTGNSGLTGRLKLARIIDDSSAPTASPSQAPAANAAGWNNSNVTVSWNWSDNQGGSGLNSAACTTASTASGEGALALTATCQDLAGNSGSANYLVKVDQSLPTLVAAAASAPNAAGWYQNDVAVIFTCNDTHSGIATGACPAAQLLSTEGVAVSSSPQVVVDVAGNSSLPSNVVTVAIDKRAPVANPTHSPAANADGWHNAPVTVNWNWVDSGDAGLDPNHCTTSSQSAGEGVLSLTATCQDLAGNVGTATHLVQVDLTPPLITASAVNADNSSYLAGVWSNQAVTVRFTCSDGHSPIASCPSDQVITQEGITPVVTGSATDLAGNSATVSFGPIQIDTLPPTITGSRAPAANAQGWNNSAVTVSFSCSDTVDGSGLATNTVTGAILSNEGANQSVTNGGVCVDQAGNRAAAVTVGDIHIDTTAPTLQPSVTPNPVAVGGSATAVTGANDLLSGVIDASCAPLDTSSAGVKNVTCQATDHAGNSASATVDYTVNAPNNGYVWSGFLGPISNPPAVNSVNAGAAVPVKFSLGGDFGLAIFAGGSPTVQAVICNSGGVPIPGAPEEATVSPSGLQFDATTNSYSYVWKSNKAWANSCRRLLLRFTDGSEQVALFHFTGRGRADDGSELQHLYLPLLLR